MFYVVKYCLCLGKLFILIEYDANVAAESKGINTHRANLTYDAISSGAGKC